MAVSKVFSDGKQKSTSIVIGINESKLKEQKERDFL